MRLPYPRKLLAAALVFAAASVLYWLLPIPGQILVVGDNWQQEQAWPQVHLDTQGLRPGEAATVRISDPTPWAFVKLLVDGREAALQGYESSRPVGGAASAVWQWTYTFALPEAGSYELAFYHSCEQGCQEWTRVYAGSGAAVSGDERATEGPSRPTKLGVVFPNPGRDWHGRQGWVVELTYATLESEEYWGIDDLARRVQQAAARNLRVLVRVDYAPGQSLPPAGDSIALDRYLATIRRLGRDARLADVYGYIIGSGYNTAGGNSQAGAQPVTAEWAARVLAGYGSGVGQGSDGILNVGREDNVLAIMRAENGAARVLVGPVTPWSADQDGSVVYEVDAPWLNYMNTLVAALDEAARAHAAAGVAQMAPDGFAVQAPGRPELAAGDGAREPLMDLTMPEWPGAQAGFRVYEQWQDIVNSYPSTVGLPLYISATNTYHPAVGTPPAENYPAGWLTTALQVVNAEPQVAALVWFIDDFPYDDQWDFFSLTERRGQMGEAAREFERLLQGADSSP